MGIFANAEKNLITEAKFKVNTDLTLHRRSDTTLAPHTSLHNAIKGITVDGPVLKLLRHSGVEAEHSVVSRKIYHVDPSQGVTEAHLEKVNIPVVHAKGEIYTKDQIDDKLRKKAHIPDVHAKSETHTRGQANDKLTRKADVTDIHLEEEVHTKEQADDKSNGRAYISDTHTNGNARTEKQVNNKLIARAGTSDVYPKTGAYAQEQINDKLRGNADTLDAHPRDDTYAQTQNTKLGKRMDAADGNIGIIAERYTCARTKRLVLDAEMGHCTYARMMLSASDLICQYAVRCKERVPFTYSIPSSGVCCTRRSRYNGTSMETSLTDFTWSERTLSRSEQHQV